MALETMKLPLAVASGLVMSGLTAPAMRMALVLLGRASPMGAINVLKPDLERLAGVRLDNAERSLDRLRMSQFDAGGHAEFVFDGLGYTPGAYKRLAGVITGSLTTPFADAIANPVWAGKTVEVDLAELRQLTTVPGILLWLRLAIERQAGTEQFRLRMKAEDLAPVFGPYLSRATINRRTAADGEFAWTSLSRMFNSVIAPAIEDLHAVFADHVVDATPITRAGGGKGVPWVAVDIEMERIHRRKSLRELREMGAQREEHRRRKHEPSDPKPLENDR